MTDTSTPPAAAPTKSTRLRRIILWIGLAAVVLPGPARIIGTAIPILLYWVLGLPPPGARNTMRWPPLIPALVLLWLGSYVHISAHPEWNLAWYFVDFTPLLLATAYYEGTIDLRTWLGRLSWHSILLCLIGVGAGIVTAMAVTLRPNYPFVLVRLHFLHGFWWKLEAILETVAVLAVYSFSKELLFRQNLFRPLEKWPVLAILATTLLSTSFGLPDTLLMFIRQGQHDPRFYSFVFKATRPLLARELILSLAQGIYRWKTRSIVPGMVARILAYL